MITHVIYLIPGHKVGCTRSLEARKGWYPKDTVLEVLEELENKSDIEAGDIEWSWADRLGLPRGQHYSKTRATQSAEDRAHWAKVRGQLNGPSGGRRAYELGVGFHAISAEQHSENSRRGGQKGARRAAELGVGIAALTREELSENGRKGALVSSRRNVEHQRGIHGLTTDQRAANGRKGGARGGRRLAEEGRSPFQQEVVCPHCGKLGRKGAMSRWHFNNCRFKS